MSNFAVIATVTLTRVLQRKNINGKRNGQTLADGYCKSHLSQWVPFGSIDISRYTFSVLLTFCHKVDQFNLLGNMLVEHRQLHYLDCLTKAPHALNCHANDWLQW